VYSWLRTLVMCLDPGDVAPILPRSAPGAGPPSSRPELCSAKSRFLELSRTLALTEDGRLSLLFLLSSLATPFTKMDKFRRLLAARSAAGLGLLPVSRPYLSLALGPFKLRSPRASAANRSFACCSRTLSRFITSGLSGSSCSRVHQNSRNSRQRHPMLPIPTTYVNMSAARASKPEDLCIEGC